MKLTNDLQRVYDFCKQKQDIADKNLEHIDINALGGMIASTQFVAEGTAYWEVRQFIEINFTEQSEKHKAKQLEQYAQLLRDNGYCVTKNCEE